MLRSLAPALLLALAFTSCHDDKPPSKDLLVVDGMTIELAELDPYVKFLDSYLPEGGRKAKVLRVVEEQLLPLHLGRRAFAAERQRLFENAMQLRAVAGNVTELEKQTVSMATKGRKRLTRNQSKLPIAMFLFDPLQTGSVSAPIEVPYGWVVAGCFGITEGAIAVEDIADALQVTFSTHGSQDWLAWLAAEQKRIADKVTFVHPDYREAMPQWLVLPKLP